MKSSTRTEPEISSTIRASGITRYDEPGRQFDAEILSAKERSSTHRKLDGDRSDDDTAITRRNSGKVFHLWDWVLRYGDRYRRVCKLIRTLYLRVDIDRCGKQRRHVDTRWPTMISSSNDDEQRKLQSSTLIKKVKCFIVNFCSRLAQQKYQCIFNCMIYDVIERLEV